MALRVREYDMAEYLNTAEVVDEYIKYCFERDDLDVLLHSLDALVRSEGLKQLMAESSKECSNPVKFLTDLFIKESQKYAVPV